MSIFCHIWQCLCATPLLRQLTAVRPQCREIVIESERLVVCEWNYQVLRVSSDAVKYIAWKSPHLCIAPGRSAITISSVRSYKRGNLMFDMHSTVNNQCVRS